MPAEAAEPRLIHMEHHAAIRLHTSRYLSRRSQTVTYIHTMSALTAMEIPSRGPTAKYKQIAGWLRDRIEAGEFGENDPLPSEKAIMDEFGVARETARNAYRMLREEDVVYTVQALGTYVKKRPPGPPSD
jgi:hypothetical protein